MAVVGSGQATRQATLLPEAVVTGETGERASGIRTAVSRGNITCLVEHACGCVVSEWVVVVEGRLLDRHDE